VSGEPNPLFIGVRAARANLRPAIALQATMLLIVVGYYWHPGFRGMLEVLAQWKAASGYLFSFGAAVLGGALLPELLNVLAFQKCRVRPANLANLRFTVIYWGCDGVVVDAFYRAQALLFGSGVDAKTVAIKVLVDQLAFTPLFAVPLGMALYEWKRCGYSGGALRGALTPGFYKVRVIPTLVAAWAVWVPILVAVYSLPPLLQVPLFALALTLWVILFTYISAEGDGVKESGAQS
jgi:hypothetical protein